MRTVVVAPYATLVRSAQEFPQLSLLRASFARSQSFVGLSGGNGGKSQKRLVSVGEPSAALTHCGLAFLISAIKINPEQATHSGLFRSFVARN